MTDLSHTFIIASSYIYLLRSITEHEQLLELQRKEQEEEHQRKEDQRRKAEAEMALALQEVQKAELEAATMAAKQAALAAVKESKERAEEDNAMKEVQRKRDQQAKADESALRDEEAAKGKGKSKLADRLNAKKEKKEKELQAKQEKEIAELKKRQEEEHGERDRLKQAKQVWTEALQTAMDKADANGLGMTEKEEYCLGETLAKKIVPETHLNEAVGRIQSDRHKKEMSDLLNGHFEERVVAIRGAVEKVVDDKSRAMAELMKTLTEENADADRIREQTMAMEGEYTAKQMAEEKRATSAMEQLHMKQQMELRQRQLQETAAIVEEYTDPEALARLAKAGGGLSQIEEMAAYRARLENDKKAREEAARIEREEKEREMRQKMADEMLALQQQLAEDQRKAEEEFALRKAEVMKQREELEKKSADEKGELNQQEKDRIIAEFEKERQAAMDVADNMKKQQKAKLAERLAAKKAKAKGGAEGGAGGGAAPTSAPPDALKAAADAVAGGQGTGTSADASSPVAPVPSSRGGKGNWKTALALAKAKAAQEQASTIAAASSSPALVSSMTMIEKKLEKIEEMMMAIERNRMAGERSSQLIYCTFVYYMHHFFLYNCFCSFFLLEYSYSSYMLTSVIFLPSFHAGVMPGFTAETPGGAATNPTSGVPAGGGTSSVAVYHDDAEPAPGQSLDLVSDDDLRDQEKVRLDFGRRLAGLVGLRNVQLKVTTHTPAQQTHSFSTNILSITHTPSNPLYCIHPLSYTYSFIAILFLISFYTH